MPSPGGQKHHYLGSTAIHPHWEPWECLTVERVCWISYRDFTTHSVKKWGFSLGLIHPSTMGWWEPTLEQSGLSRKVASYWLGVLLLREYLFFILLRRHIFVFFTRLLSLLSLICSMPLACCYLVAHIVGSGELRSASQGEGHTARTSTTDDGSTHPLEERLRTGSFRARDKVAVLDTLTERMGSNELS